MAVFHPHTVRCTCGGEVTALLADSINVRRSPAIRQMILRGELHRARCACCERIRTVEKPFYYSDPDRRAVFKVLPRWERHLWQSAAQKLDDMAQVLPGSMVDSSSSSLRVVFGMDELREKLVAQDAGIDDRLVEVLKVLLVYEHPILLQRPRLRFVLGEVTNQALEFRAFYEHHPDLYRLTLPTNVMEVILDQKEEVEAWVTKANPRGTIFEPGATWVNLWRWSPQPPALKQLKDYAAQLKKGGTIAPNSAVFKRMLRDLPRGSHLPAWAKRDLRTLFEFAKKKGLDALQDDLFEIRFGIDLEDDWSKNEDPDDIDTLWTLLKDLPDTHVEGNTQLEKILLDVGKDSAWYDGDPNAIGIGSDELEDPEGFEAIVLHEVGHAVHEANLKIVDRWLEERFGWRIFEATDEGIDGWVGLMGGWGDLTPGQRREVRGYLRKALGTKESWEPAAKPTAPKDHPWRGEHFGPRLAYEQTGSDWYKNYKSWYRTKGKAFFLNYYYKTLLVVDEKALELADKMPDPYVCMAHYEWFAEIYALYYDLNHPKRKALPKDVTAWIDKHIGRPEPSSRRPARPKARSKEWLQVSGDALRGVSRGKMT